MTQGKLPDGLSLNPATGTLDGAPSVSGTFSFSTQVTASYNGVTHTTAPAPVVVETAPLVLRLAYQDVRDAYVGDSINLLPTTNYTPVPGSTSDLQISGPLPTGITFDAATGSLSGTFVERSYNQVAVTQTVTLADGTRQSSTAPITLFSVEPELSPTPPSIFIFGDRPFIGDPITVHNTRTDDMRAFSLRAKAGSTQPGNVSGVPLPPPWLSIDALTGKLFSTGHPASGMVFELEIVYTTVRMGRTYVQTANLLVYAQRGV